MFPTPIAIDLSPFSVIASLTLGYLFGSVPFGLIFVRMAGLGDIRDIGSGNIGATNVLRTGRKGLAAATFLADALKAALPAAIALYAFAPLAGVLAGVAAFLGHIYPVWLGFRGGKGVSCFMGLLFTFYWPVGVLGGLTWLAVARLSRYSSLSALVAAVMAPVYFSLFGRFVLAAAAVVLAAVILWCHRENIARLRAGTESRIGDKSKSVAAPAPSP